MHGLEATYSMLRGRIGATAEARVAMTHPSALDPSTALIIRLIRRLLADS